MVLLFDIGSLTVAKVDLEILLSQHLKCCDYRPEPVPAALRLSSENLGWSELFGLREHGVH